VTQSGLAFAPQPLLVGAAKGHEIGQAMQQMPIHWRSVEHHEADKSAHDRCAGLGKPQKLRSLLRGIVAGRLDRYQPGLGQLVDQIG
jgi:hypothetical protein